jgi:hypothetical protein
MVDLRWFGDVVRFMDIQKGPVSRLVAEMRALRLAGWMRHIGDTRQARVEPRWLGTVETDAAKIREKIDAPR